MTSAKMLSKKLFLDAPKVVHFSTGHTGGAGLAARRLNAELNQSGVASSFYALKQNSFNPVENEFEISRNFLRKISSFLILKLQQNFSEKILFSTLSSNAKSFRYFKKFQDSPGTILHFHNWANLISERNLLKLCSRGSNIVITAHDERIITGGCHYKFDCRQINLGCEKCPLVRKRYQKFLVSRMRKRKDLILSKIHSNPWIISPSRWIKSEITSANIFNSNSIIFIPNTLGPKWNIYSFEKKKVYSRNKITIGIASMQIDSYVKAGDIVAQLVQSNEIKDKGFEFLSLNNYTESDYFNLFWQKIDCLLALTRSDNSPNVIWEALSLKIPVISVNLGGIPEIGNSTEIYLLPRAEDAIQFFSDTGETGAKKFISNARFLTPSNAQNIGETFKNLYLKILNQDLVGEKRF